MSSNPRPYNYEDYVYTNHCVECGRKFQSSHMKDRICHSCLDNLGLHIEDEEDNDTE